MASPPTDPGAPRRRILVVDDDAIVREMLEVFLGIEGYDVVSAGSGLKVLQMLREDRPDLVLLDVMMPWLDGYTLCRAIKDSEEFRRVPVVFVSARGSEEAIRRGQQAGCDAYFTKPLDMKEFAARLRELVS